MTGKLIKITSCSECPHFYITDIERGIGLEEINQRLEGGAEVNILSIHTARFGDKPGFFETIKASICGKADKIIPTGGHPIPDFCPLPDSD